MSVEENLQKINAAYEAFNAQDWDGYFGVYAESVVFWGPESPEPIKGRAALREVSEGYLTAFPDIHAKAERSFGQGDWVCVEYTLTGTQRGPLTGPGGETIPATNESMRIQGIGVYKFEGGEITEEHDYRWPAGAPSPFPATLSG